MKIKYDVNVMSNKSNWVVGVHHSDHDEISLYSVHSSEEEIRNAIMRSLLDDKNELSGRYKYVAGTESVDEITLYCGDRLYAYLDFSDFHIDYCAKRIENQIVL